MSESAVRLHVTLVLDGFGSVSYGQEGVTLEEFITMLLALREIAAGRIQIQGKGLLLMGRSADGRFKAVEQ